MHILVTGAAGLLGGRLARGLADTFDVTAAQHRSAVPSDLRSVTIDLESPESVTSAISSVRPDAVLHAAAIAMVDLCERDPDQARRVNVGGCELVARACAERGLRLVAISTDLVLAGDHALSDEGRRPDPISTYGRTKLQGEEAVLSLCPRSAVARVPLIAGRGHGPRGTASESVAWALRAGRKVGLFTDQYRTPADADSIAPALAALLRGDHTGRFHLGGPERVSRYELGLRVARVHGIPPDGIEAVLSADRPGAALRPADVSMDCSRARRELGYTPRSLDEMIGGDRKEPE